MKVLTVIATISLPLTFVAGFFGMNFGWMTQRIDTLWVFPVLGVGSLVVFTALLWGWSAHSGCSRRTTRPDRRNRRRLHPGETDPPHGGFVNRAAFPALFSRLGPRCTVSATRALVAGPHRR